MSKENNASDVDVHYMELALEEAKKGIGRTSPNPSVGCVIVRDGEVVGRGYHKKAGTPHAEIHALRAAAEKSIAATAYVTLEPCSHTGRTGPCCEALAKAGVSRVVIGMLDPNPLVNGRGVSYLQSAGILVDSGVLEQECRDINRPFIKKITTGRPLMIMKAGISLDGRLNYQKGFPGWITGPESKHYVHQLRDQFDAIMVGRGTVDIDNPSLSCRLDSDTGKNPIPVILDSRLETDLQSKIYQSGGVRPIVVCGKELPSDRLERFQRVADIIQVDCRDGGLDLHAVSLELGKLDINSVLVEGGALLHGKLLEAELYDYAYLFQAPVFAGDSGVSLLQNYNVENKEARVRIKSPVHESVGADLLIHGEVEYPVA